MRRLCAMLGNLLIVVGVGGLALLAIATTAAPNPRGREAGAPIGSAPAPDGAGAGNPGLVRGPRLPARAEVGTASLAAPLTGILAGPAPSEPAPVGSRPITGVVLPRISLEADVVPAVFVKRGGGATWDVPAFTAGHAQHTAGAGEAGNAVLLGHVSSRNAGNIFRDLDRVEVGDVVQLFAGPLRFDYRVVEVRPVPRTDLSVVEATETATVSLITCTGLWLPHIWDYTERLVVRAELVTESGSGAATSPVRTASHRSGGTPAGQGGTPGAAAGLRASAK